MRRKEAAMGWDSGWLAPQAGPAVCSVEIGTSLSALVNLVDRFRRVPGPGVPTTENACGTVACRSCVVKLNV